MTSARTLLRAAEIRELAEIATLLVRAGVARVSELTGAPADRAREVLAAIERRAAAPGAAALLRAKGPSTSDREDAGSGRCR